MWREVSNPSAWCRCLGGNWQLQRTEVCGAGVVLLSNLFWVSSFSHGSRISRRRAHRCHECQTDLHWHVIGPWIVDYSSHWAARTLFLGRTQPWLTRLVWWFGQRRCAVWWYRLADLSCCLQVDAVCLVTLSCHLPLEAFCLSSCTDFHRLAVLKP